jgi:hypothetical protein
VVCHFSRDFLYCFYILYTLSFTRSHVGYSICLSMCCRWSGTQDANTQHVKQTPRWVSQTDSYGMLTVCYECLFCRLSALHCQDDLRLDFLFALSVLSYTEACRQHVAVDSLCPQFLCHMILFTHTRRINICNYYLLKETTLVSRTSCCLGFLT